MKTKEEYNAMVDQMDVEIRDNYRLDDYFEQGSSSLKPPQKPNGVVLTCGSELTPEPVQWLWPNWLALGKLHILAGAPGQGKTTIAMAMAATVTIGGRWPDGTRCEAGNVLIWSGEDDPADTLLPRILAAGGDRSKVFFISGSQIAGEVEPFDPARDMGYLLAAVEQIGGIKMLIVDPVVSAVTGDSHKNTEVRRALQQAGPEPRRSDHRQPEQRVEHGDRDAAQALLAQQRDDEGHVADVAEAKQEVRHEAAGEA